MREEVVHRGVGAVGDGKQVVARVEDVGTGAVGVVGGHVAARDAHAHGLGLSGLELLGL